LSVAQESSVKANTVVVSKTPVKSSSDMVLPEAVDTTTDKSITVALSSPLVDLDKLSIKSEELASNENPIIEPKELSSSMKTSTTPKVSTARVNKVSEFEESFEKTRETLESLRTLLLTEAPLEIKLQKNPESVSPNEGSVLKTEADDIGSESSEDLKASWTAQSEILQQVVSSSTKSTLESLVDNKRIGVSSKDVMIMTSPPESIVSAYEEELASEAVNKESLSVPLTKSPLESKKIVDLKHGKESSTATEHEDSSHPDKEPITVKPTRTKVLKVLNTVVKESSVAYLSKMYKRENSFYTWSYCFFLLCAGICCWR